MTRARSKSRLIVAIALGALGIACVAAHPTRPTIVPAREPIAETLLACPEGYAEVAGDWRWSGREWTWVPQHCALRPGHRWEPGRWVYCGVGVCWRGGRWLVIVGGADATKP